VVGSLGGVEHGAVMGYHSLWLLDPNHRESSVHVGVYKSLLRGATTTCNS
jgi:hypothetical protein